MEKWEVCDSEKMSAHNQPDTLPNTNSSSTLSLDSTDAPTGSAEGLCSGTQ